VNYHALSDFRLSTTRRWTRCEHEPGGADGCGRGQARAGGAGRHAGSRQRRAASFRRRGTLEECLKQARERVDALKDQVQADPGEANRRAQAARERAQRDMEQRVKKALERLPEIEQTKRRNGAKLKKRVPRPPTLMRA